MSFVSLLLVGILFPVIQAKQFTKCELSQVLKDMDGYGGITLPECEFSAAFCPILHLISALPCFPPFFIPTFIQLSNNYLIFSAHLFTLLIHLFSYLFFLPFSDPFWNAYSVLCHIWRFAVESFSL